MAKKYKRFEEAFEQTGFTKSVTVLVDNETNVQYLVVTCGQGTGVTPLLNADGTLRLYDPTENTATAEEIHEN